LTILNLDRPLVCFDLETTGTDVSKDRIVEFAALKVDPEGARVSMRLLINPGQPIPPMATKIHGISDEDVRDAPAFAAVADSILDFFGGSDLTGFNVARFDIPLLDRELRDCGKDLRMPERKVVDSMTIFHRKERRDLTAAVRFFLERDHTGAHTAEADVNATFDVLEAQLARYEDLPHTVAGLDDWINPVQPGAVDRSGKFIWSDGQVVFAFGKNKGMSLRDVAAERPAYLEWILKSDFPADAQELVRCALRGEFPKEPRPTSKS
jgi:DNA polymerase-3 subunit epsilon